MSNESRPYTPRRWQPYPAERKPTITAHAGSLGTEPNSPHSFEAALASKADYLEADVRFSAGGAAYLSHDALEPEAWGKAMSLDELLVMASAVPGARLNLDLKEYSAIGAMSELVYGRGMEDRVLLTGLSLELIPAVRSGARGLPYFLNAAPTWRERLTRAGAEGLARRVRDCGAVGLNAHHRFVTGLVAAELARGGLALSVWTVDDEAGMRRFLGLGADNITTRFPATLAALRGERGVRASGRGAT